MRVDHHACQRATNTAMTGLLVQAGMAATLLIYGLVAGDTPLVLASLYVWIGLGVWIGLIILFYQHKLERLEALEDSELAGGESASVFEGATEETRPAARRLRMLHRWMLPAISLVLAGLLILVGLLILRFLQRLDSPDDLLRTTLQFSSMTGWAIAISLGFTVTGFIYSRFVAGMAQVPAWTNLRGGASWMAGNAVVLLGVSIGLVFRLFDNDAVLTAVCWAIPIFMLAAAAEIILNFIMNLYRPRIIGMDPRPAFDSKVLSLIAAPDSIVRSLNEAINYQFGFDISSSWGYQLLLRSFLWLIALGIVVLLGIDTMVIVEPTQQGLRMRQGAVVGEVHGPGLMWKLPWPFESAQVVDVSRTRELPLTFQWKSPRDVILWSDDLDTQAVAKPEPFIVNAGSGEESPLALVDIRAVLRYRIAEDGLLSWLNFVPGTYDRRAKMTSRELALKVLAEETLTDLLQREALESVVSGDRGNLSAQLRTLVQEEFDARSAGVEVLAVSVPFLRPSASDTASFEEVPVARQGRERLVEAAHGWRENILTYEVGDSTLIDSVVLAIADLDEARRAWEAVRGTDADKEAAARSAMLQRQADVTRLLGEGRGAASLIVTEARTNRWITLMATKARASRVRGQQTAYAAAPELYRQRGLMDVFMRQLPNIRKYVVGIDPSRFNMNLELRSINPLLNFSESVIVDEGDSGQ
ncbi:MAG: SPFH domain-containing protein [Phycisphaerales bacterium]|jgi:regulator of protease activity HflC (stomatin/prohibitin superfamily)|nr:SPFH domain-containing protein [Phycisphaerales bacterium]